ncbi:MAG: ATP-dependent DNA helicase RecG [Treponema sp.]|nr:ATP-dependent DNA helicase RecG [Treponema sp.]
MKLQDIQNSVESLSGTGPAAASRFAKLGIFTVSDLLLQFPRSWEDRTKRVPLSQYAGSLLNQSSSVSKVNTVCRVTGHSWFGFGRMKTLKIAVTDGTADAYLIAFNRPFLEKTFPEGSIISVSGKFSVQYNQLQSSSFEAELISKEGELSDYEGSWFLKNGILSTYKLTEGLTQKTYRKSVLAALKQYAKSIDDELPPPFIKEHGLLSKAQAITLIHTAKTVDELLLAKKTLIYEELFFFELKLAYRTLEHKGVLPSESEEQTAQNNSMDSAEKIQSDFEASLSPLQKQLLSRLSFSLTQDQMKSITQMNRELDKSKDDRNFLLNAPERLNAKRCFSMQRLLQGDVGSGKTLTAFFICLRVINNGGQCAFLAPTELLARQHAENAAVLLEPLGIRVAFLTGNLKSQGRNNLLRALGDGTVNLVIGTHALFSRNVSYKNLELAVIDEQHRFGVAQREAIIAKGRVSNAGLSHTTNLLMMSATPIPQTLSYTLFGDLDISTIRSMPKGRKPVTTYLSVMGHEQNVYNAVRSELLKGHQAYFVYPRIGEEGEESEDDSQNSYSANQQGLKSAQEMFSLLSNKVFPEFKCALIHGKVSEDEQKKILDDFKDGKIKVLVATTVVEVGVDVANATCMVIEHADRFGLAELHQLRGRVGRSSLQSFCFLIYSKNLSETGIARMKALHETTDGFKIAEEDLKLRGPGELTGQAQSGYLQFALADINRDRELLKTARYDAFRFLQNEAGATH